MKKKSTISKYSGIGVYIDNLDHMLLFVRAVGNDMYTYEYLISGSSGTFHSSSIRSNVLELVAYVDSLEEAKLLHPELFL